MRGEEKRDMQQPQPAGKKEEREDKVAREHALL